MREQDYQAELQQTPRGNRIHIALFGRRNSGKSSLINALTGQEIALVSDTPGTTTDPVYKAMELAPIGPVVFIDTAGFDDAGELGDQRVAATEKVLAKADLAILLTDASAAVNRWKERLDRAEIPTILVAGKADLVGEDDEAGRGKAAISVSAKTGQGMEKLRRAIGEAAQSLEAEPPIVMERLAHAGDTVLLVMPQDKQAPKGRLILPQVQTIRELLDGGCTVVSCTTEGMGDALKSLNKAPDLIITDSQVFRQVYEQKPKESRLTSFSVLFAAQKGDLGGFVDGAKVIDALTEDSKILIAEACTHAPITEDIGREKIPAMLRSRVAEEQGERSTEGLQVDVVSGADFPKNLAEYDLVIHCGSCMFNRRQMLSRQREAQKAGVPMTNYGIAIAKLTGILEKIDLGGDERTVPTQVESVV